MIFSALITALVLAAVAIWLVPAALQASKTAAFSKVEHSVSPLTIAQVENLMGRPARIEQAETNDQTVNGTVYDYPANGRDMKVIFVNGVVFHTGISEAKS